IGCVPIVRLEVENVAWPPAPTKPVPSVVAPSLNVTVPVGRPAPGASTDTVAVNVTGCPNLDGFTLDVNDVEVSALFTTWLNVELVLVLNLESPPYSAVIGCDPTAKAAVENVA